MEYLSLSLLPGLLWPGVVVPVRVSFIGHIELFNHLTVCKEMSDDKLIYLYKQYLKPYDSVKTNK